jgi:anti-sigma factor RsiW
VPALPHTAPGHDEILVARLAADDLPETDPDGRRARSLVAECPACAELLADLRAISTATAALPQPRRTRDFRLTEADAARLRPAGWRGLLARFGSPSFAFTRPLAAGLATLGIAGLLLAALPSGLGGSAALAPETMSSAAGSPATAQDKSGAYASAAPSAAPSALAPAEGPVAASPETRTNATVPPEGASPAAGGAVTDGGGTKSAAGGPTAGPSLPPEPGPSGPAEREGAGAGGASPLFLVSSVLLVAGLALGGLRLVARRLA